MATRRAETTIVVLLACLALLIAGYWIARFGGYVMEGDATRLTLAADGIAREGAIVNSQSYSNGYGYSALLAFLVEMTGASVQELQLGGSLWLSVLSLTAYLTYRELTGDVRMAALALFLLLCQCDFLFYILRSSHERTTWTFGLLVLWLWARSRRPGDAGTRATLIPLFYLLLWAIIANNAFFGSTLIVTFLITLLCGAGLSLILPRLPHLRRRPAAPFERRLLYVLLSGAALLFIFTNYVYPPAISYYYTLGTIGEKVGVLLFGSEPMSERIAVSESYSFVQSAWVSRAVYLALTGFQWATVLAAAAAWLRDAIALLRHGAEALSPPRLLLWLFFLGYAAQVAMGVVSDLSGAMGSNLQVRLFTPFALVICPMAATWLAGAERLRLLRRPIVRRALVAGGALLGAAAVSLGLLKLTNDPLVGNFWLFYTPAEQAAVDWAEDHLVDRKIWIDTWPHQHDILQYRRGYSWQPANDYASGYVDLLTNDTYSHILLSEPTIYQASRSRLPLPATADRNSVYDNGDAVLYHRRQRSPFQR